MAKTNFYKCYGATERQDRLVEIGKDNYLLLYGHGEEDGQGYEWRKYYDHRPALSEVREDIHRLIDRQTDEKIESGCRWQGMQVWLSEENQRNYKAAYDLAVQLQGQTLPLKFKLGEDADGEAQYYTFEDMTTFTDFYTTCIGHIQQCLQAGWEEKDSMDWAAYE